MFVFFGRSSVHKGSHAWHFNELKIVSCWFESQEFSQDIHALGFLGFLLLNRIQQVNQPILGHFASDC